MVIRTTFNFRSCIEVVPQILQFWFGDDPLNSGEMLSISCTIIKGDLPVYFSWNFNGEPIELDRSDVNIVVSQRVSFLSIDSVAARHAGKYECIARNAAGFDSHTATLSVNGRSHLYIELISLAPHICSTGSKLLSVYSF